MEEHRIWKFVDFTASWQEADTSNLDDLAPSWYRRRIELQENSEEYSQFLTQLKRQHAIETGVVERLYDLGRGITETFIKEGFHESLISHGDTDISTTQLMYFLVDHLESIDFVFDVVKKNRPLTVSFIKEIHALVTRHQADTEGRDSLGRRVKIPLLKGSFKVRENNPVTSKGVRFLYCPPEQVASEMDNLIRLYGLLEEAGTHPLILSAWFHHAFTTIHPFQDGNGRVGRLLSSLILIKHHLFPFTVLREESKLRYILALEKADEGGPQPLVDYFATGQRRNIEKVLTLRRFTARTDIKETARRLTEKLNPGRLKEQEERLNAVSRNRKTVFELSLAYYSESLNELEGVFQDDGVLRLEAGPEKQGPFEQQHFRQVIAYTEQNGYRLNRNFPLNRIILSLQVMPGRVYQLVTTFHHYGFDDSTLAIGAFMVREDEGESPGGDILLPFESRPYVLSIDAMTDPAKWAGKIQAHLSDVLKEMLAFIESELP